MAESEINGPELVSDDALKRPGLLSKGLKQVVVDLDLLIKKALEAQQVIGNTTSTKQLSDATTKLLTEQKKLMDVQHSLTQKIVNLENANKKLKDSTKDLTEEKKKHGEQTEANAKLMEILNEKTEGAVGAFEKLKKTFLALATNPFILGLAGIVLLVGALVDSVKYYFETTGEGASVAKKQAAVWNQFFNVLKQGWRDLGKSVSDAVVGKNADSSKAFIFGLLTAAEYVFPILSKWIGKIRTEFAATVSDSVKASAESVKTTNMIVENIISTAKTERDANKLIAESQEAIKYNDSQRLQMIDEGIKLKKANMEADVEIAKRSRDELLIEIGLRHSLTEEETLALTEAQKRAKFTVEERKELAQSVAKVYQLEADYYANMRRLYKQDDTLKQEIKKKQDDAIAKALKEQINSAKRQAEETVLIKQYEADAVVSLIEQEVVKGNMTLKKGQEEITKVRLEMAVGVIQTEIDALLKLSNVAGLTADEQIAIEKKLVELKKALYDADFKNFENNEQKKIRVYQQALADIGKIMNSAVSSIDSIFKASSDKRLLAIQQEQKEIEYSYQEQIRMAGDNEERKKILENEAARRKRDLDKRRIEEQRRAMIFEKASSFVQAEASLYLAVLNQASKGDPYTALGRVAIALAALAPLVALISNLQVPQYKDGTKGTTTPIFIAGEEGEELYRTPGGKVGLTPAQATLMSAPIGTEIIPHDETMRVLATRSLVNGSGSRAIDGSKEVFALIERNQRSLENTIRNKKETHFSISKRGAEIMLKNAETRSYFLNEIYK